MNQLIKYLAQTTWNRRGNLRFSPSHCTEPLAWQLRNYLENLPCTPEFLSTACFQKFTVFEHADRPMSSKRSQLKVRWTRSSA